MYALKARDKLHKMEKEERHGGKSRKKEQERKKPRPSTVSREAKVSSQLVGREAKASI